MWTNANRARYEHHGMRFPSDLTDEEWKLIRTPIDLLPWDATDFG
jgi:hypothetical protein